MFFCPSEIHHQWLDNIETAGCRHGGWTCGIDVGSPRGEPQLFLWLAPFWEQPAESM
jgi:hypothetical protein